MSPSLPLPPAMVQRAREFTGPPAPARPAATVVLLDPETLQVYVLKRASTMVFGGVYAFPGGRVDPADHPETIRQDWAQRLGVPDEQARAVVGAAVRELFEEAGVLLAGPVRDPGRTVGDVSGSDWEADRLALLDRTLSLSQLLARRELRLRDDLLLPWARWITPEFEPKRFDTWFFVALLPQAQTARDVSGEADGTAWVDPGAVEDFTMLPPTRVTLAQLAAYRRIDDLVAAERDAAAPVMPRVELAEDGGAVVRIPDL
ncbi:NUDIX domain-containing protein [Actinoplanes sp. N902-109]|uniref:NUDIX hydrolase n=1 Tax=Actinoplanes sp. (strain N902-109) TaxID=649831 RepID=UPI0003294CB0|nr:NUDIX domain-containing protein [Actinoplanes sp. N902-109]AGL21276.1 NUDIX hydrolase [Actinoplanes sp. N902-109]